MLSSLVHCALFVVTLAVCFVAWECIADEGLGGQDYLQSTQVLSKVGVTTTTTATAEVTTLLGNNQGGIAGQTGHELGKSALSQRKLALPTLAQPVPEPEPEPAKPGANTGGERDTVPHGKDNNEREGAEELATAQLEGKDGPAAAQKGRNSKEEQQGEDEVEAAVDLAAAQPDASLADRRGATLEGGLDTKAGVKGRDREKAGAADVLEGAKEGQKGNPPNSGPAQSAAATTATTTMANKVAPAEVPETSSSTSSTSSTAGGLADKNKGIVTRDTHGEGKKVKGPLVTAASNTNRNNNGDRAEAPATGPSGKKETHQQQALKSTTTTAEPTASAESSTTSSAAPTQTKSTLPKRSTISNSVNNKDSSSSSTSLLLSFASLTVLAAVPVALAY